MSGSISKNAYMYKVLVYVYTNFGAFFHKMHNSFGMPLHYIAMLSNTSQDF